MFILSGWEGTFIVEVAGCFLCGEGAGEEVFGSFGLIVGHGGSGWYKIVLGHFGGGQFEIIEVQILNLAFAGCFVGVIAVGPVVVWTSSHLAKCINNCNWIIFQTWSRLTVKMIFAKRFHQKLTLFCWYFENQVVFENFVVTTVNNIQINIQKMMMIRFVTS